MARLGPYPRSNSLQRSNRLYRVLGRHFLPDPLDHHAQKIVSLFHLLGLTPPLLYEILLLCLTPIRTNKNPSSQK